MEFYPDAGFENLILASLLKKFGLIIWLHVLFNHDILKGYFIFFAFLLDLF